MRLIILILTFLSYNLLVAQINVGSVRWVKLNPGEFETGDLEALQEAEVLFVIRQADIDDLDELQTMLEKVWTFSKIKVITDEELADLEVENKDQHAYFVLEGHATIVTKESIRYVNSHYYLHLYMHGDEIPYTNKQIKRYTKRNLPLTPRFRTRTFARMELYPDGEVMRLANGLAKRTSTKEEHKEYVRNEAHFYNWEPGFLKNALQEINRHLEAKETRWIYDGGEEAALANLTKETLYVPDYLLIKYNKFKGTEDKRHEEEDLFGKYDYAYEIMPAEDLSDKIMTATEPFYYFNYVRSSTDAYYTVINGWSGEIIYSAYDPVTYNIKGKNITAVKRAIHRMN